MARGETLTTVVFADAEGSTGVVDRLGDDAGTQVVGRQLDVLRSRLGAHGGREVKSLGDGLLLTFASPRQAVAFAVAAQRALGSSVPRVRMGINTGEVIDADGDPVGAAVNAAARIAALAAGGEVLLADVVRQLAGSAPAVRFVDRGRTHLRGIAEPVQLWSAVDGMAPSARPATIGRLRELEALRELVTAMATGSGRAMVVRGEAGIGKSHLLAVVAADARAAGMTVVELAVDEVARRPGALAFALAADQRLPRSQRSALRSRLEGPGPEAVEDRSYAVMEGAADALEVLTRTGPVLVVADDLHWADDLSLGVARAVARRTPSCALGLVAACRPAPRPALLDRLVDAVVEAGGPVLEVGPLDALDVLGLSAALTGAAPAPRLRARLEATAGNPLFVAELLRSLEEEQSLRIEGGVADVAEGARAAGLASTVLRRLSWLPEGTRDLLKLASLLGSTFTLTELGVLTGSSVVDIAGWMRDATASGLVVGDGDRLRFRHDVVREAVYDDVLAAERRDLHRAAAQALARAGAPVQQVAWQFARGAAPGDDEAVAWLVRAADEVASVAPSAAVELLERALAIAPPAWEERARVQARLIEPLAWCGRFERAESMALAALATAPELAFEVERGLASVHGNRGNIVAAIEHVHRAAALPGAPERESARLACFSAQLELLLGTTSASEAQRRGEAELARAAALGDATGQCVALQVLGAVASVEGRSAVAADMLHRAMALYGSGHVRPASYLIPDLLLAGALLYQDELAGCLRTADQARRRHLERGALTQLPLAHMIGAAAHLATGAWADADAEIDAGLAMADESGSRNFVLYFRALRARLAVARGRLDDAAAEIALGLAELAGGSLFGADWLLDAQAGLQAAQGDAAGALATAEVVWGQVAHLRFFYGHRDRAEQLARLALGADRPDLAAEAADCLEEAARRTPVAGARAAALHARGLADADSEVLVEAVAELRRTPYQPQLARAAVDLAALLAVAGERERAGELLAEAAGLYASLGANGDLARVQAEQARLGAPVPRARQARPAFGWGSLTPMEVTVTALVCEGLTNPEIGERLHISRRTVESHLAHAFRKVGCTTRTQLATEAIRAGVGAPA